MKRQIVSVSVILVLGGILLIIPTLPADTTPPEKPVKLIFIHHSVGENWLSDDNGGLGTELGNNNYFVSDTYYGWGPDAIGDRTDIPDWLEWFTESNRDTYMNAVYRESRDDAAGYDYYNRPMADPGGENSVILFKSCYPNSNLAGNPTDPIADGPDMTVGGAKYVYTKILSYFSEHPEKLFIAITPPPEISPEFAESAEAFSRWMANDWLDTYGGSNVRVFDLHAVLSSPDNHHTAIGDTLVYETGHGNTLTYPTDDPHPSKAGNIKATTEFVPLLNYYYHQWIGRDAQSAARDIQVNPAVTPVSTLPVEYQAPVSESPLPARPGKDSDHGREKIGESWVTYDDGESGISLSPGDNSSSFCVETDVIQGGWATVETLFDDPEDWSGYSGISFGITADLNGIPYSVVLYGDDGNKEKSGYSVARKTGSGDLVYIPWSEFSPLEGTGVFNPKIARGMFFSFEGGAGRPIQICIDDLKLSG